MSSAFLAPMPYPLSFECTRSIMHRRNDLNDLTVCILKGNFKDTKHRKLTELQFIINFEKNMFGFNKDIYFLSKYATFKH